MAILPHGVEIKVTVDDESINNLSNEVLDRLAEKLAPRIFALAARRHTSWTNKPSGE